MKTLHKWAMAATVVTAGLGIAVPARAEVSAADIAVIAQTCVAIDRGDITEEDLDILDDEEYGALMEACGFAQDGVVEEAEMAVFEEYYVIFQEDVAAFETVIYETSVETESYEELDQESMDEGYEEVEAEMDEEYEEAGANAEVDEEYEDEADLEEADADMDEEYEEDEVDDMDEDMDEADADEDMDESAMDEAETEEG